LSPLKFSSLKYDMTCVVCFQKFIISYKQTPCVSIIPVPSAVDLWCRSVASFVPGTRRAT
jgi:hypothetical protein